MATVHYLTSEIQAALGHARYLAECGVPLFLAQPDCDASGAWRPTGGHSGSGYWLPADWQKSVADQAVVDRWKPGMALCAVMGWVVDGLDFDPRHGGDRSLEYLKREGLLPRSYGCASTPSGGTHELVASRELRSRDGLLPGVDFKAGVAGEGGHGFLFVAPTVKLSKATGELGMYAWEEAPQLDELLLVGGDDSGAALAELLLKRTEREYDGPAYDGPQFAELTEAERAWADAEVDGTVGYWKSLLDEAADWPEGMRDDHGRGWEALARDCAWALASLAVTPWTRLDDEAAQALYEEIMPDALLLDSACAGKWDAGLLERAAEKPVEPPPWDGLGVVRDLEVVNVTNHAAAAEWLRQEIGAEGTPLAGMFRQDGVVIHTPRIGETGYVPLTRDGRNQDGPAQVRVAGGEQVLSRVQFSYRVVKQVKTRKVACLFPEQAVDVVLGDVSLLPNLRGLRGVTHTPMMRRDGTVLYQEGYDPDSERLYLPGVGLKVGEVPDDPDMGEVLSARDLLLEMVVDFPFNTDHDRANYLALLLTPLMREMLPPPYKLGVINAHQRGSGKSLLAWILRTLHGGVMRGDVPGDGEEFRKQITTILMNTTAPVVQFDNVRSLRDNNLDALLTTDVWSDRGLGGNRNVTCANDRLWVVTGNNVVLGGDLVRRALWVSIDPQVPHPEERTDFVIEDLKGWVRTHRGELLRALLVLLRTWVAAGRPMGERVGEDDYARWIEACRGVLKVCGIGGVVGHGETVKQVESGEDDEWAEFLSALWQQFGDESWTAAQAAMLADFDSAPEGMKMGSARSVGKWLANRRGQWSGGFCIREAGVEDNMKTWRVHRIGV